MTKYSDHYAGYGEVVAFTQLMARMRRLYADLYDASTKMTAGMPSGGSFVADGPKPFDHISLVDEIRDCLQRF